MSRLLVALASVLLLLVGAFDAGAVQYTITDLGTLGGTASQANAINAKGQVAGWSTTTDGHQHAFLWTTNGTVSVMTDLGTLRGGAASDAMAVDINGFVAGWSPSDVSWGAHQATFNNGTGMQNLGTLGAQIGATAEANGMNDSDFIVGSSSTGDGETHAFLCDYNTGAMGDLGTLGGHTSQANGINQSNQVVGWSDNASGIMRAFLYWSGTMRDLGTLGGAYSDAMAINDAGQVVGWAYTGAGVPHAFLYSGTMTDLGTLSGGTKSQANGINGKGQIVGYSTSANGVDHAFLYSGGTMTDLNSLIDPSLGWVLSQATAINDSGQIVCTAFLSGVRRALLLSPSVAFPGDANLDGKVDIYDLNKVLTSYDKNGMSWGDGDFDGDGNVTVADLNKVLTNYNKSSGLRAVPEPSTLILLGLGALAWLGGLGRKKRAASIDRL